MTTSTTIIRRERVTEHPGDDFPFTYRMDGSDKITFMNDALVEFADENGAPGLAQKVLGKPLWNFIDGPDVQHVYSVLLKRIRKTGEAAFMPFRCDSPAAQCYMEMRILPLPDAAIEFQARMLRVVSRRPQPLSHGSSTKDSQELLEMCATCKRVNTQFGWLKLELAVDRLDDCDQCYNIFVQA